MSFRSIARDLRESFGSLSRRSFDVRLPGHYRGKSHGSFNDLSDQPLVIQNSRWAKPELLYDVIRRLEESESTWPTRKHVVACAAVCRSWRSMCKEIVKNPELCGKLTFRASLKQPGSPLLVENGKFLLSAKRTRRTTCTEYVISMDADNISRSSSTYICKLRLCEISFIEFSQYEVFDIRHTAMFTCPGTGEVKPPVLLQESISESTDGKLQITYELNVLGTRGPRKMKCIMHSIPIASLEPGGVVPGQPELIPRSLEDSFRSFSFSKSQDHSTEFSSSRFSETAPGSNEDDDSSKTRPLVVTERGKQVRGRGHSN
ncbi:hypothetical protein SASPL_119550 [Salvia splendens]|uniref:Tubby C-terminal domain-containing protein n=1 Tax=Salvia splendens TaxID=180675 RepID=A0A8X8XQS7_SALSN|nr:hypothetical protein SASPL_119550 [Salvia splendens]